MSSERILVISTNPDFISDCLQQFFLTKEVHVGTTLQSADVLARHFDYDMVAFEEMKAHGTTPDSAEIAQSVQRRNPKAKLFLLEDSSRCLSTGFREKTATLINFSIPPDVSLIQAFWSETKNATV